MKKEKRGRRLLGLLLCAAMLAGEGDCRPLCDSASAEEGP